ncbi:RYR2 [Lepeophtheirus salmonis]|uniref:RYR2 n=1 Tax=Lepeophtheirus salmonis TaxID=72036 RepID=A0A7R8CVF9_LEPSM|nr:RYR2 [Lepeophtheirus salmonis]CAF2944614.1 RYR2 [Lepeophtheirus salmonis]
MVGNGVWSTIVKVIKNQNSGDDDGVTTVRKKTQEEKFRKVLVEAIIRWGSESEIESKELVREMFNLLIRQYDTVGELMKALENTYVVDTKTSLDVVSMWVTLSRIRSLLPVQMSKPEEELVRELLWTLVNNHVFFQHPDLMLILRIHENQSNENSESQQDTDQESSYEMVVACCRFLCYFCRTSRQNQKAMFDHLIFILEHANILLSRPALRGSTPLDVAYSSLMDNTELALALRENHLEKIAFFLSRCGLTANAELVAKGYPDLGWDPVEGERYLDFLRFCVWVGGESVEENANLVIRLLIRRPECLGPALRGEGEGLLSAIRSGNTLSEQITNQIETGRQTMAFRHPVPTYNDDEDFIDTGAAILTFYCTLVDLLGRCAPEASVIAQGKNDSLRARAILRSLVPLEDLQGVLGLSFSINYDGESDMPTGLIPNHKQSMALFLERTEGSESDMGLALNRYIGNSILPILIKYNRYYADADNYCPLLEATLHTVYRLNYLVTLTKEIPPIMLLKLLRQLTVDLSKLNEYSNVALRMLTLFYERCSKYYGAAGGQGIYGCASDEEKKLTMTLFNSIFDSLSQMEYDPELFSKALPCLTAIGCALPPDYSKSADQGDDIFSKDARSNNLGPYIPVPIDISHIELTNDLNTLVLKFSEHYHDAWAQNKLESGWTFSQTTNQDDKKHSRLKPYNMLDHFEKETYQEPVRNALTALIALNWNIENTGDFSSSSQGNDRQTSSNMGLNPQNYHPNPADMTNLTLSREMMNLAERLSEDAHDNQVSKMTLKTNNGLNLLVVPYDLLTEKEKKKNRERCQELLKYIQYQGYNLYHDNPGAQDRDRKSKSEENRFSTNLLDKLIMYLDASSANMKLLKPSENFTRRNSFKRTNTKRHHRTYFTSVPISSSVSAGVASIKEKQLVATIFCKLANLIRIRQSAFGCDTCQAVKCLQVLVKAIDAKSLAKLRPEFAKYPHLRGTHLKTCTSLKYIFEILIPILISTFDHLAANEYGHDLVIDEIQVACYKILESLYITGTNLPLTKGRKFIRTEIATNRALIGTCLASISSTLPVAFLEPSLNRNNPWSVSGSGFAERSLEAQEVTARLEQSIPTLDILIGEVEKFINDGEKCRKRVEMMFHKEESCKQYLKAAADDASQIEGNIQEEWNLLSRDVYAFYPLLIKFVDLQKTHWIRNNVEESEQLYNHVGEIFNIMSVSNYFRKEEQNFVLANEIDILALIMPSAGTRTRAAASENTINSGNGGGSKSGKKKKTRRNADKEKSRDGSSSLIVAALKRLLPVGLNLFAGKEQELVQHCKDKFLAKFIDEDITSFVKTQLTIPKTFDPSDELQWQHHLYSTLGNKQSISTFEMKTEELEQLVHRIIAMGKVLYGLHIIDHPSSEGGKGAIPKVVSIQRKRAVIACFRQISLHSLPRHAAEVIIDHLTQTFEDSEANKGSESEESGESKSDQVSQLIHTFSQGAIVERSGEMPEDNLFISYANIMARSCGEEEEEGGDDEGDAPSLQEQEIEKMRLLFNQGRLASRGASEMVLNQIGASKGEASDMVESTLNLGIAILRGGNIDVQTDMLNILKEKRDTAFFTSVSGLMNSCTVLNLDAFERNCKAEGLGVGPDGPAGEQNMHDAEFTTLLFRFLQLTSEGHNNDWQNYLRTQAAIGVASQVFNTLTEVIQGPCVGNQQTLAHSRLWDAVNGFFFLFAHMQDKLSKDSSQVDLLQELLNLQKDLIVMLLSMLEGNVLNGTIGKQMVDTLVESASNVELILQYFKLFLNLPGEDDLGLDNGTISPKDFKEKLESTKNYSEEDIEFLLLCCDTNHEGNIDFNQFSEMFVEPSKEIGFNLAVLLTNLSEHMPNDPRLAKFLESAGNYENNIEQWEKPQIKESKRAFFYATITEGGDKEKLECFVDFCEDAIFEMQHAESLMKSDDEPRPKKDSEGVSIRMDDEPRGIMHPLKEKFSIDEIEYNVVLEFVLPIIPNSYFLQDLEGNCPSCPHLLRLWVLDTVNIVTEIADPDQMKKQLADQQAIAMAAVENLTASKNAKKSVSVLGPINFGNYAKKIVSFLARNFFTMKFIALTIAFIINFMLLFYKVSVIEEIGLGEDEEEENNIWLRGF